MRFTTFFILAFLILKPLIRTTEKELEPPIIVFAQDNSESLLLSKDSSYFLSSYQSEVSDMLSSLNQNYEVKSYTFGERLKEGMDSLDFKDKQTDFSQLLNELYSRFSNRNLGAIILATDGIYNKGSSPVYDQQKLNVPIYVIALGDTTEQKDVRIAEVAHNKLAYLGNRFPIQIDVEAKRCSGERISLEVSKNGDILFQESFTAANEYDTKQFTVILDAKKTGLQKYSIRVSRLDNEVTYLNNRQDIYLDVLDSKQKILVLAAAPHPDVAAIKESIGNNENYEVQTSIASSFKGDISKFDLVVFHQLPGSSTKENNLVKSAIDAGVSTFFILGGNTNFNSFNSLSLGFSLKNYQGSLNDVSGTYAEGFSTFQLEDQSKKMFQSLPPLQMPFGNFETSPGAVSVLYQRIGIIETTNSLLALNTVRGTKTAVLGGEGIWRWRMVQYLKDENHEKFNGFIQKLTQYLATRENKNQFQITGPKNIFENENVLFEAQVYDANYEALENQEIELTIISTDGTRYPFAFSQNTGRYRLDAGQLQPGNYSWESRVIISGKSFEESGEFSVSPLQIELANVTADHRLLFALTNQSGGEMMMPKEMNSLSQLIAQNNEVVTVSYEFNKLTDLIELKWLIWLLLIFLGSEWLLRKRSGTY
jgi:hypothetical protein